MEHDRVTGKTGEQRHTRSAQQFSLALWFISLSSRCSFAERTSPHSHLGKCWDFGGCRLFTLLLFSVEFFCCCSCSFVFSSFIIGRKIDQPRLILRVISQYLWSGQHGLTVTKRIEKVVWKRFVHRRLLLGWMREIKLCTAMMRQRERGGEESRVR